MDSGLVATVMKAEITLQNMVVEERRNGYRSKFWSLAEKAVGRGLFVDENGESEHFQWKRYSDISENAEGMDNTGWAAHVASEHAHIKDIVHHYALKLDLEEHIWRSLGDVHK